MWVAGVASCLMLMDSHEACGTVAPPLDIDRPVRWAWAAVPDADISDGCLRQAGLCTDTCRVFVMLQWADSSCCLCRACSGVYVVRLCGNQSVRFGRAHACAGTLRANVNVKDVPAMSEQDFDQTTLSTSDVRDPKPKRRFGASVNAAFSQIHEHNGKCAARDVTGKLAAAAGDMVL